MNIPSELKFSRRLLDNLYGDAIEAGMTGVANRVSDAIDNLDEALRSVEEVPASSPTETSER